MRGRMRGMAQTRYVEMRLGESWSDVASAFLTYCQREKGVVRCGCHEGDPSPGVDQECYAALSIPFQYPDLIGYLQEWADREQRRICYPDS